MKSARADGWRDAVEHLGGFVRRVGRQLNHPVSLLANRGDQRIEARAGVHDVLEHLDAAQRERVGLNDFHEPEAGQAVDDDRLVAVRQLEELEDGAGHADRVKVAVRRVFDFGIALRADPDQFVAGHDLVEQRLALGAAHVERHDRAIRN